MVTGKLGSMLFGTSIQSHGRDLVRARIGVVRDQFNIVGSVLKWGYNSVIGLLSGRRIGP